MRYIIHGEQSTFTIHSKQYKAGLFAMPILLHPQLVKPGVDPLTEIDYEAIGRALEATKVLSKDLQNVTFLARAVDASFICSTRGEMEVPTMMAQITLHRGLDGQLEAQDLFRLSGYDRSGGGLVFLLGVIYRGSASDEQLYLPEANDFLVSRERLAIEAAMSGSGSGMYRHQVLAPYVLSEAIGEGLGMAVRCWTGMHEDPLACNFDLAKNGDVTLELGDGESTAVSIRFGQGVVSEAELALVQSRAILKAGLTALPPSYVRH